MNLSFAHIVLNVTELARSRKYYDIVLRGFSVIDESSNHVGYSNGSFSVWIADTTMDDKPFIGVATDKAVGTHHFAFKVSTIDELREWESYLRESGVAMSKDGITDDDFGGTGIFLKDPDGIRLEIHLG